DPCGHGGLGASRWKGTAVHVNGSGVVVVHSEDGPDDLAASCTDEPGQGDDLTGAHTEGHVGEDPLTGQALHLQEGVALLGLLLRIQGVDLEAAYAVHYRVHGRVDDEVTGDECYGTYDRD